MAGRRISLSALAGAAVESTPGSSKPTLVHVAPDQVAPTPLNPRQDFNETQLVELGNSMRGGQLQPCVGVTRARYVKLFPEHESLLPDCRIVMAAGERRWKAAQKVGLATLDVHVREDIAESRVRFLAAVLSENVERANFNFIEEARGLRQMLEMSDGNQTRAAEQLNKSKQWFSQRIGILRLSEEMQALVFEGKLTAFREMRKYSVLPADEQMAAWEADRKAAEQREAQAKATARGATSAPTPRAESAVASRPSGELPATAPAYTAVYAQPSPAAPASSGELDQVPEESTRSLPEPRGDSSADQPINVPQKAVPETVHSEGSQLLPGMWEPGEWESVFDVLMTRMGELDRHRLTKRLQKVMEEELATALPSSRP
ncbi:ParB/RepB/Spo0J family partition protein [Streptomyces sp. sk2.1]|uniref:ParB/RepB/Spo0J family partition protein n=1 Tax=Streptomyces sp. sk2.1 TaxID=2478959 RepID=UPI0011E80357|nr:ParB/RepB/Spo0J family partition protein [Streptomyces sp. sk2.1]TXS68902.1 ParB/RepB/Spo0J family partition protein [Streptomyces sp. sk2.1]